jgi:hypothetical protein
MSIFRTLTLKGYIVIVASIVIIAIGVWAFFHFRGVNAAQGEKTVVQYQEQRQQTESNTILKLDKMTTNQLSTLGCVLFGNP